MNEAEATGDWHLQRFAEFAVAKAAVGEPSPHMTIVGWMSRDQEPTERLWRAGCYLVPYSVLTAEAIWREWPFERARSDPEGLTTWVTDHWAGMHTRIERRCVRTPTKFARSLVGYGQWLEDSFPVLVEVQPPEPGERYELWWDSALRVPFFGRYITIRLLEFFRRYAGTETELQDIRSIGGWSPIRALQLLRPDQHAALDTGKLEPVDRVAREVLSGYQADGLALGFYGFAALLCEYRVAWEKRHQYPGWQHDQELEFSNGAHAGYWRTRGYETELFAAREALFPPRVLGENGGWPGRRYDVAAVLRDQGYVWTDLEWNYMASRGDLSHPVRWPDAG